MIFVIESDTVKLLRECDAGIKMGIYTIENSMEYAESKKLIDTLENSIRKHKIIEDEIQVMLEKYHDDGKKPPAVAKGMSWVKTNFKLAVGKPDSAVADFIIDGCNMGVKSLSKYKNQYKSADEKSKDLADRLIEIEEKLSVVLRKFL